MDCFNQSCPFRINETSNVNRCECMACPNKCTGNVLITSNRTLTDEDIRKMMIQTMDAVLMREEG